MIRLAVALCLSAAPVMALNLDVPGNPRLMFEETLPQDSFNLPVARWNGEAVPMRLTEGEVTRQVWRIAGEGLSSQAVTSALRAQLQAQGFAILLDCTDEICGGFDFRRAVEVLPPPAMHVNLSDFRYLSAETAARGVPVERVGIMVSTAGESAAVQIIRAGAPLENRPLAAPSTQPVGAALHPTTPATSDFTAVIESAGRVVLDDLAFETGSAQLAEGEFASLVALAAYLADHPARRIALVGHTDTVGALDVNITLSKRRAASVVERLARDYGVPRQQITAEGTGYLSPLAANLTPEGRSRNRRVEAVLLSTE